MRGRKTKVSKASKRKKVTVRYFCKSRFIIQCLLLAILVSGRVQIHSAQMRQVFIFVGHLGELIERPICSGDTRWGVLKWE